MKERGGELGSPKEGRLVGLREDKAFLFIEKMEELHSFFKEGRAVSHFGRRSMSSIFTCGTAGAASCRI
jgi:hypothetical protein